MKPGRCEQSSNPLESTAHSGLVLSCHRELDAEGVDALGGFGPDTAFMIFYDVLGDGEAEAVAMIHRTGFVDAIEALEDFFEILWADRVPRI